MKRAIRVGDFDTDGDILSTGSDNVLINYQKAGRQNDIDNDGPDSTTTGSDNVLTNGRRASREGDSDDDGDTFIVGSPNVFIN
jgi:uncharacterized Zn-binding protein involved in type VI secretion